MNLLATNLRRLRLARKMTQEQLAEQLGVSAQSISRWETAVTYPDVMLLPELAGIFGVLVDDLFKPSPKGYDNNAQRLLAIYEHSRDPQDYLAAEQEFAKLVRAGEASANDWRCYGVLHEYMMNFCMDKAMKCYRQAMEQSRNDDPGMYHRTVRQSIQLRCRIGQADACMAECEAKLAENPNQSQVWVDLSCAYYDAGKTEQALEICEQALQQFPQEAALYVCAGDSCRMLKRYEQAFVYWRQAMQVSEEFLDALFSMAFCHEELGEYDKAAAVWESIAVRLNERGMEVEAQMPGRMAERCRAHMQ